MRLFTPSTHHLAWYRRMLDVLDGGLSPEEAEALRAWERQHVWEGDHVTADWPGWEKHIGLPPWKKRRTQRRSLRWPWQQRV